VAGLLRNGRQLWSGIGGRFGQESADYLKENNKRTRADVKILCSNMVMFILLWVLNPECGYLSVLSKAKIVLLKCSRNIADIITVITDAGLCKARRRFAASIIKRLWQVDVISNFINKEGIKLWKKFQVCVIDGTTFTLNKSEEILKTFPLLKKARWPQMMACVLYDIYTKIPLDIECSNGKPGERKLLLSIIEKVKRKTLLILDRGYPAYYILHKLMLANIEFVIRIPKSFSYTKVKRLGQQDWLIKIKLNSGNKSLSKKILSSEDFACLPDQISLRLILTKRKGFRPRYIITSLLDTQEYTYTEISELYCDRWICENYYRDLKHILKIENFHAEYVDGIYQEIYAAMILTIVLQKYIIKAAIKYKISCEEISFKRTFQIIADFIFIMEFAGDEIPETRELLLYLIASNRQKKRPGRHFERIFFRKIKCKYNKWK